MDKLKQNIKDIKELRDKRMSKISNNKQSPRNSSYDRGSLLKGLSRPKGRAYQKGLDAKHARSSSATDNIQVRGLNQTASMMNILGGQGAKGKANDDLRPSLKGLKENPKAEIKSLIIMNPSFNSTQMTLTN